MGRKQSNTVDYFPHYAKQGKTLTIVKGRFGNDGYAFLFQLLELLCSTENHFYDCNSDEEWQFLLAQTGVDETEGEEILKLLAKLGTIHRELWEQRRIIWCDNLVKNLDDVYKKRLRPAPQIPLFCIHSGTENPNSVPVKEISATESTQSKVKYSRVDNKENNKRKYGEFLNVLLTDEEYKKLTTKLGEHKALEYIERLSAYMKSKGKRYQSHYATILNWSRREEQKSGTTNPRRFPKAGEYTHPPDD